MKFSSVDIYNKEFKKSVVGGYNIDEVDNFLDEIGMNMEKIMKERNQLKKEKVELSQKLKNYEDIEDKLETALTRVSKAADKKTEQARQEAQKIITQANQKADEKRARAEEKAEQIINQAEEKASGILQEAKAERKSIKTELKEEQNKLRDEIDEYKRELNKLKEAKELFEIKFKNLLDGMSSILEEENDQQMKNYKTGVDGED
ncbi:MAG: DivIVA domain-containing protein [Bacillota bacterium]